MTTFNVSVEVKSKTDCPWCHYAKVWLGENDIAYTEQIIDDDTEREALYDALRLVGPARTVPQVILVDEDGKRYRIGGYLALTRSRLETLFAPRVPRVHDPAAPVTGEVWTPKEQVAVPGYE